MCSHTPPGSVAASMLTIRFPIWVWIGVARPAKPESATSDPTSGGITDSGPMVAGRFGNPNPHLAMAITPQPHLPRQRLRHPSSRQHRLRRENLARRGEPNASDGELAQVCLAVLAVVEFVDSLCCGLPTCGPARLREGRSCSQPILRPEISVPNLGRL
jgi:hypothetical protein